MQTTTQNIIIGAIKKQFNEIEKEITAEQSLEIGIFNEKIMLLVVKFNHLMDLFIYLAMVI